MISIAAYSVSSTKLFRIAEAEKSAKDLAFLQPASGGASAPTKAPDHLHSAGGGDTRVTHSSIDQVGKKISSGPGGTRGSLEADWGAVEKRPDMGVQNASPEARYVIVDSSSRTTRPTSGTDDSNVTYLVSLASLLVSCTTIIGFFFTYMLAWRKEKRDVASAEQEANMRALEIEKLRRDLNRSQDE